MKSVNDLQILLAGDYSGIEVCMLAQVSRDPLLIKQFNNGVDVHSQVGNKLTDWPVEKIRSDKAMRTKIKRFHFGIAYGLGPVNGARNMQAEGIKITKDEFADLQSKYFKIYSYVKRYIDSCHQQVEEVGWVETLFGFRRYIKKVDDTRGSFYLNQAINTPIQGSAHQLVLIAMALLRLMPKKYNLLQTPVMEIHDELVFSVRVGDLLAADRQLRMLLQEEVPRYVEANFPIKLLIPLKSETEAGFLRGTAISYEEEPIPSLEQFLDDWRAKYKKVAATPLVSLIHEEVKAA
jgi:DNA polymerase-1